jgi:hypothetical protein
VPDASGQTQELRTTDEHPFYSLGGEWVQAGKLTLGDRVAGLDGQWLTVESSTREDHPEGVRVYNLEVEDAHTYFVAGAAGPRAPPVWVHNRYNPVKAYDVGTASALRARSIAGDAIDIHHVGQSHALKQVIPGYKSTSGAAIALPEAEHLAIPKLRGTVDLTPRQILAKDARDLRMYTNAPNSSLRELIQLNKRLFAEAFAR